MSVFGSIAELLAAGGVGGFCTEIVRGISTRKKIRAEASRAGIDADVALSNAALSLLEPAREQIAFLRQELTEARAEGHALRTEVKELRDQVAELTRELTVLQSGPSGTHGR